MGSSSAQRSFVLGFDSLGQLRCWSSNDAQICKVSSIVNSIRNDANLEISSVISREQHTYSLLSLV